LIKIKENRERKKSMKHLIDIKNLSVEEINELIKVANDIIQNKEKYSHKCNGKN